ncbi:hypothetical protein [Sporolactobacillus vineae]|uniref:hypothetical protein n=1 Tax=Sporolactobacillus vineae TaxID=444463 RepID=UPI000367CCAE|nr:hypothetical protein [Sporolactobacillus vineae]
MLKSWSAAKIAILVKIRVAFQSHSLKKAKDCVVIDVDHKHHPEYLYAFPDVAVAFVKKDEAS